MPKCENCGTEIAAGEKHKHKGKLYVHNGKVMCESCLVDTGIPLGDAEPYETYIKIHTDRHRGGLDI